MNDLALMESFRVFGEANETMISSLKLAEILNSEHKNVIASIERRLRVKNAFQEYISWVNYERSLDRSYDEINTDEIIIPEKIYQHVNKYKFTEDMPLDTFDSMFTKVAYRTINGRKYAYYYLSEDLVFDLITEFNVTLKWRFINQYKKMADEYKKLLHGKVMESTLRRGSIIHHHNAVKMIAEIKPESKAYNTIFIQRLTNYTFCIQNAESEYRRKRNIEPFKLKDRDDILDDMVSLFRILKADRKVMCQTILNSLYSCGYNIELPKTPKQLYKLIMEKLDYENYLVDKNNNLL